jgi:glycosyltransferase involved in cell wall biosynthesis
MKPCIWYVSKYMVPPGRSGAGARGYHLMRELARQGDTVVMITSDSIHLAESPALDGPYLRRDMDGMQVWWVRTLKYRAAKSLGRILSWLHFEWRLWRMPWEDLPKPDTVIVSSLSLFTIFNGLRMRARFGSRLVFEVRDIWPLTLTEEGGFSRWNPLVQGLGMIERLAYRRADLIIGTMPNLGEHVQEVLGRSRPVACVPMGFDERDLAACQPLPAGYAEQYLPSGKFLIAYVGTIGITNALETLMACAERLASDTRLHFVVVGAGDLREQLQRRYGHLPNLTFGARVKKDEVQAVLAACDVAYLSTFPSRVWRFGQSLNKLVDYMLSGKVVVASFSGFPSMIDEAGSGVFVPAGDSVALALEFQRLAALPPGELRAMGERGRRWMFEHRTYPALARQMRKLLFPSAGR